MVAGLLSEPSGCPTASWGPDGSDGRSRQICDCPAEQVAGGPVGRRLEAGHVADRPHRSSDPIPTILATVMNPKLQVGALDAPPDP